jgi:exosortase/archaeosortase family protein
MIPNCSKYLKGGVCFLLIFIFGCWLLSFQPFINNYKYSYAIVLTKLLKQTFHIMGLSVRISGNSISHQGFQMVIAPGCIALHEAIVFAAAIIAYPMKLKDKITGVALGIMVVLVTNVIRLIILFLTGIFFPSAFKLLHEQVGQILYTLCIVIFWIMWVGRASLKIEQKNVVSSQ